MLGRSVWVVPCEIIGLDAALCVADAGGGDDVVIPPTPQSTGWGTEAGRLSFVVVVRS